MGYVKHYQGSQVIPTKVGLLTTYPWSFEIQSTHNSCQMAKNLDIIDFKLIIESEMPLNKSFNVKRKNNVAIIQTGHTNGTATDDEQKIMPNLIFYCNQLLRSSGSVVNYDAIDKAPPKAPHIIGKYRVFYLEAEDQGTTYTYRVECYNKDDTTPNGLLANSTEE